MASIKVPKRDFNKVTPEPKSLMRELNICERCGIAWFADEHIDRCKKCKGVK